jgi:hypothetical protein
MVSPLKRFYLQWNFGERERDIKFWRGGAEKKREKKQRIRKE